MWLKNLTGFNESKEAIQNNITLKDGKLKSKVNNKDDDAARVASEDADATAGAVKISVFKGGNFNANGLTVPDDATVDDYSDNLWLNNIHIETNISGGA